MSDEQKHRDRWRERNAPHCDTCDLPVVWSELFGWRHSTARYPFGDHRHIGHEASAKNWSMT